jgi:hypothetical protein
VTNHVLRTKAMNKRTRAILEVLALGNLLAAAATHAQGVSFLARRDYPVGASPSSVAVGDFNGDGVPDLAVANYDSDSVSVLINDTR